MERDLRDQLRKLGTGQEFPEEPEDEWKRVPSARNTYQRPLGDTDVYMDDFIQIGQGGPKRMRCLRDHLLWAIDAILAKPGLDETRRTEAVSLKKLLKGDGSWCTRKEILGWIIDTIRQTLELPSHRKQELVELLAGLQDILSLV